MAMFHLIFLLFPQIELIDRVDDIYRNTTWDDEFKGYGVQIHQVCLCARVSVADSLKIIPFASSLITELQVIQGRDDENCPASEFENIVCSKLRPLCCATWGPLNLFHRLWE